MASPSVNPMLPAGGSSAPGGAPSPNASAGAAPPGAGAALPQKLARMAMDAQSISSESPETAPMMREIQNQVRMAMMKMIQSRQQAQQQTPPI